MNRYQKELAALKPHDEVQEYSPVGRGYYKIYTAGHGYLVVPHGDIYGTLASSVYEASGYGFAGVHAFYLEEDSEAPAFMRRIAEMEGSRVAA